MTWVFMDTQYENYPPGRTARNETQVPRENRSLSSPDQKIVYKKLKVLNILNILNTLSRTIYIKKPKSVIKFNTFNLRDILYSYK